MESIGLRIKKIRKEYGLNQKEFGERLGVTNAHISRMEKGITEPSEALSKLICKEFGISMDWLKNGHGPMEEAELGIDDKMYESTTQFNKLLRSDNNTVRNLAAELNVLYASITGVDYMKDDLKILYLNNIINLLSIVNKYTKNIKEELITGQLILPDMQNNIFSLYKNDLLNYVDELQRFVFLAQRSDFQ